ncbi:MAG: transcriptional repressor [Treponema sp.]|nr:transcriptional repressor [Treponema sp.]
MRELDLHATAEQVYEYIATDHPSISKATVYRNLSQMAESGDIVSIGSFYGATHYDHNCHNHYHFICDDCKRIFDLDGHFPDLCDRLSCLDGHEIRGHSLNFNGLCQDCRGKA